MSEEWHYATNGKQLGPVSASNLKALAASGKLMPSDMVVEIQLPKWPWCCTPMSASSGLMVGSRPPR